MTAAFIERRFELGRDEVIVRFFAPVAGPEGEHRCEWQIIWPARAERKSAYGLDGVQALLLAMRSAHSSLRSSAEYRSGTLTYCGEPDLGLPPGWDEDRSS